MSGAAPVTVAVISWNTRELLARCLDSLAPEDEAERADVWVVDNASADGSAELVRERHPWAKLIPARENLGFGRAVNLVAERTDSRFLAAANADVELRAGALPALLDAAARHPLAGAFAPQLLLPDGTTQHSVYHFPTLPFTAAFNLGAHRLVPGLGDRLCLEGYWDPRREREVDWALGAFLLIRREAWRAVGGFASDRWMYAEDLDLGWRLARHGWSTCFVPAATVGHHGAAATSQRWGARSIDRWMAATYAWMSARRGRRIARAYGALNLAGAGARWAGLRALATVWPSRFAASSAEMAEWWRLHRSGLRSSSGPASTS